jgi:hypothetical protein
MLKLIVFLSATILLSCGSRNRKLDCNRFKAGKFLYYSKLDGRTITIERNDSIQTEINKANGHFVKAKIKWTHDCQYELTYMGEATSSADAIVPYIRSHPLKTEILEAGKDYFIFKSTMEGIKTTLIDTMFVLQ